MIPLLPNRVVLQRAGAEVVRIKGFSAIFKCASACALLAHFKSFATYALPKVASRAQIRCLRPTCNLHFLHWNHTPSFL